MLAPILISEAWLNPAGAPDDRSDGPDPPNRDGSNHASVQERFNFLTSCTSLKGAPSLGNPFNEDGVRPWGQVRVRWLWVATTGLSTTLMLSVLDTALPGFRLPVSGSVK